MPPGPRCGPHPRLKGHYGLQLTLLGRLLFRQSERAGPVGTERFRSKRGTRHLASMDD